MNAACKIPGAVIRPRIAAWVRVSSDDQHVERQMHSIKVICARYSLDCVETIVIEGVSGTDCINHPDAKRVLGMIERRELDGIVIDALDRWVRVSDLTHFGLLQPFIAAKAKLYMASEVLDGGADGILLKLCLLGGMAGNELVVMRNRISGAMESLRRSGKCGTSSATLPLGVGVDEETRCFRWTADVAVVRDIFHAYVVEGLSFRQIQRRTGVKWMTIRNLLANRIYLGERVYDQKRGAKRTSRTGKVYKIKEARAPEEVITVKVLEPIIDAATFERAQRMMANGRRANLDRRKAGEHLHAAAGLLRCSCDAKAYYVSRKAERGNGRRGYVLCARNHCTSKPKINGGCPQRQPNLPDALVDVAVWNLTVQFLKNPEHLAALFKAATDRLRSVVSPFPASVDPNVEIAKLQRRAEKLIELFTMDLILVDELREKRKVIEGRIAQLRSATAKIPEPEFDVVDLARRIAHGVGALERVTDQASRCKVVAALWSELRIRGRALVGARLNDQLVAGGNVEIVLDPPVPICPEPETHPEGFRRCSACDHVLPEDAFPKWRGRQCRTCAAARARACHLRRRAGGPRDARRSRRHLPGSGRAVQIK